MISPYLSPSLLRRLASLLYDAVLLLALLLVATFLFLLPFGNATEPPLRYVFQLYLWLVAGGYFVWCWHRGGQTLAMQTWRIRLTDHVGMPLSLGVAAKRYVLASLGLAFFGAGFIWAIFDRERLFLHDRLGGTRLTLTQKG